MCQVMPLANCRRRPSDDLTSYSLISCQVSTSFEKCVGHRDTVAPHRPTTTRVQNIVRLPDLTHVKVLPKEMCYLKFVSWTVIGDATWGLIVSIN